MTGGYEPVLHALSIDPRVARPGETIGIEFRTRNLGAVPSPPATVTFALPDGLDALAGADVAVEPVAPGEAVVATILARVGMPLEDRTELAVQAALRLPDAVLGTNVCTLVVRSCAVLDGPASGTFVEASGADTVRVRTIVTNEGDGPARDVRVVVPAPSGCACIGGDGPATLDVPRLDVGERATVAIEARIVEPIAEICANDAVVELADGRRCAVPVRGVIVPEAAIAPPVVTLLASRRRAEIAIDVLNDGWADAADVRVHVGLPKAMKIVEGSVFADGAPVVARTMRRRGGEMPFARVVRAGGGHEIVLLEIPARGSVRLSLSATHPGGWSGGTVGVDAGGYHVEAPFVPEEVHDVRVRIVDAPRAVSPGQTVHVTARVVNGGDAPETLRCTAVGDHVTEASGVPLRSLGSGVTGLVELVARIDDDAREGTASIGVIVSDAGGERTRAERAVVVRKRDCGGAEEPAALAPPDAERAPALVVLRAPEAAVAGAPFSVRVDVTAQDAIDALVVRVPAVANAAYVSGSTSLDDHCLLDRAGRSPFDEGLVLRAVPAGAHATLSWSLLADAGLHGGAITIAVCVESDGRILPMAPVEVRVLEYGAFATRPNGLAYHVDARSFALAPRSRDEEPRAPGRVEPAQAAGTSWYDHCVTEPASSDSFETLAAAVASVDAAAGAGSISFALRLDAERVDDIARLLGSAHGAGLVSHVLSLRAMFPTGVTTEHPAVDAALSAVGVAVRDVFDRLFVKLRIPGFYVGADDLEDAQLRLALRALFERLVEAIPAAHESPAEHGVLTRARAAQLHETLRDAPYGAPAVLRALAALTPGLDVDDPVLADAFGRYGEVLDGALMRYEGVPLELFEDALAHGSDRVLDGARTALLDALRARVAAAAVVC